MSHRNIRLDLNLFRILDAIYTNGGISGAARALHLTQPAITRSLNRLREIFNDPLFIRQGNKVVPTEKTRIIMPKVQLCLSGLQSTVSLEEDLNFSAMEMVFTVGFRDVLEATVLPILMELIQTEAPKVTIISRLVLRGEIEKELISGGIDLVVDRRLHMDKKIRSKYLCDESLVVVMGKHHPLAPAPLQRSEYMRARHVVVARQGTKESLDTLLSEAGQSRSISLVCQHYYAACKAVASSELLLTMPSIYANEMAQVLPVVVHPLPIRIKPIRLEMYWNEIKESDRAHTWLRDLVVSITDRAKLA